MSYPNLGPAPKAHDPQAVKRWLQKLNRRLGNNATPIFNSLTLTSDKKLVSTDLFDWIDGTSNQVTVSDDGDGTVTLGTPQDIHTGASPTFSGLTLYQHGGLPHLLRPYSFRLYSCGFCQE